MLHYSSRSSTRSSIHASQQRLYLKSHRGSASVASMFRLCQQVKCCFPRCFAVTCEFSPLLSPRLHSSLALLNAFPARNTLPHDRKRPSTATRPQWNTPLQHNIAAMMIDKVLAGGSLNQLAGHQRYTLPHAMLFTGGSTSACTVITAHASISNISFHR